MSNADSTDTSALSARIRRVSIASIAGWSRVALAAHKRGDWAEAKAAGAHVQSIRGAYDFEMVPGTVYYVTTFSGRNNGLIQFVKVGARGAQFYRRLRADGTATKASSSR